MSPNTPRHISENSSYKVVALLITLILWVVILGSKEATVVKMIRTEYLLPKDLVITNTVPHEVAFRISGPRLTLKRFADTTEPLSIDLTSAIEGNTTIRIHPDSIDVPPGLRVSSVSPATISPKLERLITRKIPVEVQLKGTLRNEHHIVHMSVMPPTWEVTGVRSVVEGMKSVLTEPVALANVDGEVSEDVKLVLDGTGLVQGKDISKPHVKLDLLVK